MPSRERPERSLMFDIGTFQQPYPIERRSYRRRVVRRPARILPRFENDVLECMIRDQSPEGVRVSIFDRDLYPASLLLGVVGGRKVLVATPIWSERFDVGLRVVRSFDLTTCGAGLRARLLPLTSH